MSGSTTPGRLAAYRFIDREGGYSNDPLDPGGETKFGISKRFNPDVDIPNLTVEGAAEILERRYWKRHNLALIDDLPIAVHLLDQVAGPLGPRRAVRCLQAALRSVDRAVIVDGVLGPRTAREVNEAPSAERLMVLASMASEFACVYRQRAAVAAAELNLWQRLGSPPGDMASAIKRNAAKNDRFLNGWLARCYCLEGLPFSDGKATEPPIARGSILTASLAPSPSEPQSPEVTS